MFSHRDSFPFHFHFMIIRSFIPFNALHFIILWMYGSRTSEILLPLNNVFRMYIQIFQQIFEIMLNIMLQEITDAVITLTYDPISNSRIFSWARGNIAYIAFHIITRWLEQHTAIPWGVLTKYWIPALISFDPEITPSIHPLFIPRNS